MNPSDEAGGAGLPPQNQTPQPPAGPLPSPPTPPAAGQPATDGSAQALTFPLPPQDAAQAPATHTQTDVQPTTQTATPQVVDDGDLIEKEWVNKAKEIVERNRNDPHKQSEELTAIRADYMKKQFNKDIKLDT